MPDRAGPVVEIPGRRAGLTIDGKGTKAAFGVSAKGGSKNKVHHIRIEDNIVVTKDEPEVLSKGVPKTVAEIESLMAA